MAHRGFAGVHPENTLGAELAALQDGADTLDIDIMPCKDGTPVAFHDPSLGRLTDLTGLVANTTCRTLQNTQVLDSGLSISTLREMFEAIPSGTSIQIEFKNPGAVDLRPNEDLSGAPLKRQKQLWLPFTRRVVDLIDEYDHNILIAASREAALAAVRELNPSIPVAFYFSDSIQTGLSITRTYNCEVVYPPVNMISRAPFFNSPDYYVDNPSFADIDLVKVAHEEGREIYVFTISSWYEANELRQANVDGILSNLPRLYSYDYHAVHDEMDSQQTSTETTKPSLTQQTETTATASPRNIDETKTALTTVSSSNEKAKINTDTTTSAAAGGNGKSKAN